MKSSVKLGGSRKEASKVVIENDESWEYTILGLNNAWIEEVEVPDYLKRYLERPLQTTQFYQGDDMCIDGNKRKTVVLFECGRDNHIIQFRVDAVLFDDL